MDKIILRIIELLETYVKPTREIKKIFNGDPIYIPQVSLPAITVNPLRRTVNTLDTCSDYGIYSILINLILDGRMVMNKTHENNNVLYEAVKIVEETDIDLKIKSDTIIGVVRERLYDDNLVLKVAEEEVNYAITERRGEPTIEVFINLNVYGKPYLRK